MKNVVKAAGGFTAIVLISTMIKWNHVIDFMNLSIIAAQQVVTGQEVSVEFRNVMDSLSIEQFVNIPFLEEHTGKTIDSILEQE